VGRTSDETTTNLLIKQHSLVPCGGSTFEDLDSFYEQHQATV
jgi:hypothetical protein